MRKQDLVRAVAKGADLTEAQATAAVNSLFNSIQKSLAKGEEVSVSGFGAFRVVERAARDGRNPRTGEPMRIDARKSAAFRPGTQLKAAVEED